MQIRIHNFKSMRIRTHIQGFDDQKCMIVQLKKIRIFWYRRSRQPLKKRTLSTSKHEISSIFHFCVIYFCPPWSGSAFANTDSDPADHNRFGSMRIRISTTLVTALILNFFLQIRIWWMWAWKAWRWWTQWWPITTKSWMWFTWELMPHIWRLLATPLLWDFTRCGDFFNSSFRIQLYFLLFSTC